MKSLIALAAATVLLSACATTSPTLYAAQHAPGQAGFSDYRLEAGRYRVTFQGGPGAPEAQVADYALLRAAELAVRDGYDWFRVADRAMRHVAPRRSSSLSIGGGSGGYGRGGGIGVGLGASFNLGPGPAAAASLEVVFGKGPPPTGADVYRARDIIRTVGEGRAAL